MSGASTMPQDPTVERLKDIRAEKQVGIIEARRIADIEILDAMIENCFTMHDVRATLRKFRKLTISG